MISRRDLLRYGGGLAGLAALTSLPRPLRAGESAKNLLIVFAYGGWDPTYLFDPRPEISEVDTPKGEWQQYGALDLWRTSGTANVRRFFRDWADRAAVLNGIAVNSLVHEECAQRILTGASTVERADIGARVADLAGRSAPLPYHVMGGNAKLVGLESIAGTSGYSNQLSSLVTPSFAYSTTATPLQPSPGEAALVESYLSARADALARSSGTQGSAGQRLADYRASLARAAQIQASAQDNLLSDQGAFGDYDYHTRAVRMLAEGFSKTALLTDGGYWDTHYGNDQQSSLYNALFSDLNEIMAALDGYGIVDDTVILVISEMGRSPQLNAQGGKDHWPYTSAMVIGPTVRSGMVLGTDDVLQQAPIDLVTGAPDAEGRALVADDLLATVTALVGLDPVALYPDGEVIDAVVA